MSRIDMQEFLKIQLFNNKIYRMALIQLLKDFENMNKKQKVRGLVQDSTMTKKVF